MKTVKVTVKIRLKDGRYKQKQYGLPVFKNELGAFMIDEYTETIVRITSNEFAGSKLVWWAFKRDKDGAIRSI